MLMPLPLWLKMSGQTNSFSPWKWPSWWKSSNKSGRSKGIADVDAVLTGKFNNPQGSVMPVGQRAHRAECDAFRGARQSIKYL